MTGETKSIGVVGLPGAWSTELLLQALRRRERQAQLINPAWLELDLERGRVLHQGRDLRDFDALMVKKLGTAYAPDLLDRLSMLSFVHSQGLPVFSAPARMGAMINRLDCTLALKQAGIPMPPTMICQDPAQAYRVLDRLGPCLLKPLYTSKAKGMTAVRPGPEALDHLERYQAQGHRFLYMQQLLQLPGHDLGLVFLGGRYLCTYARGARIFGGNGQDAAQGGNYFPYQPSPQVIALADKAQAVFGLDFTCVDIVETEQGPLVLEVSAFGGFRGIWEAHGLDAAELYVDHVLGRLAS